MYPITKKMEDKQLISGKITRTNQKPDKYGMQIDEKIWINGKGLCPHQEGETVHVMATKNRNGFWWIDEEEPPKKTERAPGQAPLQSDEPVKEADMVAVVASLDKMNDGLVMVSEAVGELIKELGK